MPGKPGPWKINGKNWFYAEFLFPRQKNGVPLRNQTALLFINGWMPFTLWLDGRELFRETHAWKATGPAGVGAVDLLQAVIPATKRQTGKTSTFHTCRSWRQPFSVVIIGPS